MHVTKLHDHLAAATWHLGHAAMQAGPGTPLVGLAKEAAERLRDTVSDDDLTTPREVIRALLTHPDPPGESRISQELHAKLDATVAALEVLHLRLSAGDDDARWTAMVDALAMALEGQQDMQALLREAT